MLVDEGATYPPSWGDRRTFSPGVTQGDVLVFTNSSHRTYLVDADNDDTYLATPDQRRARFMNPDADQDPQLKGAEPNKDRQIFR